MERRNINTVGTIFNDFLGLYTGERPVGIRELIQKYDKHPVLMGLLSNVDSIIYVDVKKAMYEIYHGERYWFDEKDEDILRQSNREFEQTPPAIQLFYHYFKAAGDDREGEFLSPMEILDYLQKRTTISLSSGKANHFGRLLQKAGIPSRHTNKGTVYRVVKL